MDNKFKIEVPFEWQEQLRLAEWLDWKKVLWYHIPNGGTRFLKEAVKLTRLGVKSGCPDIVICHARKGYHGMYIELKRTKGGTVKDKQLWWMEKLNQEGYLSIVCRGADIAIAKIEKYLFS